MECMIKLWELGYLFWSSCFRASWLLQGSALLCGLDPLCNERALATNEPHLHSWGKGYPTMHHIPHLGLPWRQRHLSHGQKGGLQPTGWTLRNDVIGNLRGMFHWWFFQWNSNTIKVCLFLSEHHWSGHYKIWHMHSCRGMCKNL